MNNAEPERLPDDAIVVSKIDFPQRTTVKLAAESIVARFYQQEFTYRHVWACILKDPRFSRRDKLNDAVRMTVHNMYKNGKILLIRRGSPGIASVYRNHPPGSED